MIYSQVNVKTQVVVGDPKYKICEAVENLNADLLVMGSRAYGRIKRYKALLPPSILLCWYTAESPRRLIVVAMLN